MRICRGIVASLCFLAASSVVWGQLYAGSITGVVQDPSGALVPNAQVTLTDVATNFRQTATTDNSGRYVFHSLKPTAYMLTVEAGGFSTEQVSNITLAVNQNLNQNVTLQVGKVTQSVSVSEAGAAQIQTEDASTGQTVDRKYVSDLPLIGREVFDLAFLAPGVSQPTGAAYGPGGTGPAANLANNFVSQGSRNGQADIVIDGVSSTNYDQNTGWVDPLYTPSVTAVQEFKIQQTNFSAEFGFTGSTVMNVVTRSGGNQFHGNLYEFWRNNILNTNNYFDAVQGIPVQPYHWNDFGGAVGGPIVKNKLFFFFDYDGNRTITPTTKDLAVPTVAERGGDFGSICTAPTSQGGAGGTFNASGECSVQSGQIYDPYSIDSTKSIGGNPYHDTFIPFNNLATYASAGNSQAAWITPGVAGNLINPVAVNIMKFIPMPNISPSSSIFNLKQSNYLGNGSNTNVGNQFDIKLDFHPTQSDVINLRASHAWGNSEYANLFGTVFDANTQGPTQGTTWSGALSYDHTFTPKTLLTLSLGYTHQWSHTLGIDPKWDPTSIGMPADLTVSGLAAPPAIDLDSYAQENGNAAYGGQPWSGLLYASDVGQLMASVSHTASKHDLKFGGEIRLHRINFTQWGLPGGRWEFNQNATGQQFNQGGDSMASFMIGYATGWDAYEIPASPATQNFQYAGFVQDNWHISDRLTVNLGLRYDVDMPRTERYNRMSYFDPNAASPVTGVAASAACPACGDIHGSFEYVGADGNPSRPFNDYWGAIGPRLGLAYRIGDHTVVRGGYGIYYDPSKGGAAGLGSGGFGFAGYDDQNSPYAFSNNFYPTQVDVLGQPEGTAFEGTVIGNSLGNKFGIGELSAGSAAPVRTYNVLPREQSWSFGIQREIPWKILVDAEYVGKKGTNLYLGGDNFSLNHVPENIAQNMAALGVASPYLATGAIPADLQAAVENLTAPYSNGFWGGQWQVFNGYLPYPQYGTTTWGGNLLQNTDPPIANAIYNGFQLSVEKRFSQGLQFLGTYTNQKSIDNASLAGNSVYINGTAGATLAQIQDPNCPACERSLSQFDISQVAQLSVVYELPFGRGKQFGTGINKFADTILGGWQVNGIYRWDTGLPLILYLNGGTPVPTFGNQRPDLNAPLDRASNWDVANYFSCGQCTSVATKPAPYADGTAPRVLPNIRAPGTNNLSASVFKNFPLGFREGAYLQFRAESFNALNHVQFAAPNTTVDGGSFGEITSQANQPRILQLGLQLNF